MGLAGSCLSKDDGTVTEQKLMVIRNHPNRVRRRSSIAPDAVRIRENRLLEDLCSASGVEPDVPADMMGAKDLAKLARRLSMQSEPSTNTKKLEADVNEEEPSSVSDQSSPEQSLNKILESLDKM